MSFEFAFGIFLVTVMLCASLILSPVDKFFASLICSLISSCVFVATIVIVDHYVINKMTGVVVGFVTFIATWAISQMTALFIQDVKSGYFRQMQRTYMLQEE